MDPVTQGLAGALCAQAVSRQSNMRMAAGVGWIAGMAPDLDVLIRASDDSLLAIEFHRHFTHSFVFIPTGALLVALILWWPVSAWLGRREKPPLAFAWVYLWALLGMASHGVLDAATSYGTQWLWPFSNQRVAWNLISVIDPLFTVPVLVLMAVALLRTSRLWAGLAACWALLYLGLGGIQQHRAEGMVYDWAQRNGLTVQRVLAKPAFANLVLWRGLVDDGRQLHSIAVRILPFQEDMLWPGAVVQKVTSDDLPAGTRIAGDLQRFEHFSGGWTFRYAPYEANGDWFIGDFRYAIDPASQRPLWGIRLRPDWPDRPVVFERPARLSEAEQAAFFSRLRGEASM
ncbi:MAG: metal-dependent hydrolase [Pseudomonadota bacterium]